MGDRRQARPLPDDDRPAPLGLAGELASPTQGAILGAAARTFADEDYEATTVQDLLRASGVSRGTFYKYFRSKEDVLVALYTQLAAELVRSLLSVAREGSDPLAAIRFGIDAYLDFHRDHRRLLAPMVEQAIRASSPLFEHRRELRRDVLALLGTAYRQTVGEAALPWLLEALLSALEGVSLELTRRDITPEDVTAAKRAIHRLVDAVIVRAR